MRYQWLRHSRCPEGRRPLLRNDKFRVFALSLDGTKLGVLEELLRFYSDAERRAAYVLTAIAALCEVGRHHAFDGPWA
jgi:hypothetical protein